MQKMVKAIKKNSFQEIRVGITELKGNDLIDIRVWTKAPGSDEVVPTPKGVTLNVSFFNDLKDGINELEKELRKANLLME